ncbi:MAG: DEAD/DEAH box helicase, partial [Nitrospinota bacterium]|nr:DEAD/DEAH box helicase [Nitrospinota bacterium]
MAKPDPLEKLRRPLQFASRNDFSKIDALTGLERSVSAWLREIEAAGTSKATATRLKELGEAVRGFDSLDSAEKRRRVEAALRLLDGIEKALQRRPRRHPESPRQKAEERRAGNRREAPVPEKPLLTNSIQRVRGVGPKRAETFARLGIRTIGDALFFLPRKYVDRSRLQPLSALRPGREETFSATVLEGGAAFIGRGRRIYEVTLGDSTGVLTAVWFAFRTASMKDRYRPGRTFLFSGVVHSNPRRRGRLEVHHPEVEELEEGGSGRDSLHTGRIVPFYPATEGVRPRAFRVWMKKVVDEFSGQVADVVPSAVRKRRGLLPLTEALRGVHFPPGGGPADASGTADPEGLNAGRSPWHRRLIFDELFGLQTGLALRRDRMKRRRRGRAYDLDRPLTARFLKGLPFDLTSAQKRVLGEIGRDLLGPSPMNRLLQGDVGSGKTVVAVWAALSAIQSGHQAALLAPTEILAEQHAANVRRWTDALGVRSGLLTGRMKERERADLLDSVMKGAVSLVIGTHALIQAGVRFRSLGLA